MIEIENIIEICVAIDIAIIGIAYPIIVDKISNIGEKFSSEYISTIFDDEFPQKPVYFRLKGKQFKISIFKLMLYVTILTFFLLIFNFRPLFEWNNWFINNSAKIIVLISSVFLGIFFFTWLNKVVLYNSKASSLLNYIISKYNKLGNTDIKSFYLKSINELTYYAIDKQDEHLQKTLLEFYYHEFSSIRKNHDRSIPLVYPIELYYFVNKLNKQLMLTQNQKLEAIEHDAISGKWLLGQDSEGLYISDVTYNWLWNNLNIICENDKFIRLYWANSNQYIENALKNISAIYDENFDILNKEEITERIKERQKFLEFNYAVGGLLLYREKYKTIKYIFEYSQSSPPKYVLLPQSMTDIFKWFENFRNEFTNRKIPIDITYYFPELDNLGNRRQVIYWICRYITLLFIRQYSLTKYFVNQQFTTQPDLPITINELSNWLDTTLYFEKCLNDTRENKTLLSETKLNNIVTEKSQEFNDFIASLKTRIKDNIGNKKLTAPLSPTKIEDFKSGSNKIISGAFEIYNDVVLHTDQNNHPDTLNIYMHGGIILMPKSSFTDDDVPSMDYDTIYAGIIAQNSIKATIPKSFSIAKTERYVLNRDNIISALQIIIGNRTDVIIVAVNLRNEYREIIEATSFYSYLKKIISSDNSVQNELYVLKKDELPTISHLEFDQSTIIDFKLGEPINADLKIYASIIDINLLENQNLKNHWNIVEDAENLDLKVQASICFTSVIKWNKERDVIQINLISQFQEQGITTSINNVRKLKE